MAMRPSTVLFLLTVAIVVSSISSKRIIRKGKVNPSGKNKASEKVKAEKKKAVTEEPEEESSEYEYSDEESGEDSVVEKKKEVVGKKKEVVEKKKEVKQPTNKGKKKESTEEESEEESDEDEEDKGDPSEDGDDDESLSISSNEEFKGEHREDMAEKGIFYSLKDIKAYLKKPMYEEDTEIAEVLKRFNNTEIQALEKLEAYGHKPPEAFYVVEGVNPETRRKVAQTLAHRLKGLYLVNQPRILLGPIPKEASAKKAYYALSKYAMANKVLMSLFHRPVVIESYWTEHASYIMAKVWTKANKLPSPHTEVYRFPEDLLKPNVTFGIFNSPPPRIGRSPSKTYLREQRQLLVYKRVTGVKMHIVRFPESAKQISDKVDMFLLNQGPRRAPVSFEITLAE